MTLLLIIVGTVSIVGAIFFAMIAGYALSEDRAWTFTFVVALILAFAFVLGAAASFACAGWVAAIELAPRGGNLQMVWGLP